ncbi:MAG: tryptophanyl-tRNA synthetase [Rickettsiaceae bacterium]|jgi:tryptophanyl-tRNA synthetase|nr:tryptophanyl-tRNA synthetase [Rickettsiaceae bacterium]
MKKRVLSGIQATGTMHLGNYLGAIKNWLNMQEDYECFFFIADLHAITIDRDPAELKKSIIYATAAYLACGLDPKKVTIFAQSSVKEHAELAWILGCSTPLGWLNRMTQFKDKSGANGENANLGLYSYPVLMSADILLYNADIVPVGEDQKQHLELARDIAGVVNRKFNSNLIKVPEPMIQATVKRIMSLKDGTKKMSKSDPSDQSRINLTDNADTIMQKLKRAQTDSELAIYFDADKRPAISNLLNIYSAMTGKEITEIVSNYEGKGFAIFKQDLAELLISHFAPITAKLNDYLKNQDYILGVLEQGANQAREVAEGHLKIIKEAYGFLNI